MRAGVDTFGLSRYLERVYEAAGDADAAEVSRRGRRCCKSSTLDNVVITERAMARAYTVGRFPDLRLVRRDVALPGMVT